LKPLSARSEDTPQAYLAPVTSPTTEAPGPPMNGVVRGPEVADGAVVRPPLLGSFSRGGRGAPLGPCLPREQGRLAAPNSPNSEGTSRGYGTDRASERSSAATRASTADRVAARDRHSILSRHALAALRVIGG
jgi:hypothetical protein